MVYERSVAKATAKPAQAALLVSRQVTIELNRKEDDFMMVLAPYMHKHGYTLLCACSLVLI